MRACCRPSPELCNTSITFAGNLRTALLECHKLVPDTYTSGKSSLLAEHAPRFHLFWSNEIGLRAPVPNFKFKFRTQPSKGLPAVVQLCRGVQLILVDTAHSTKTGIEGEQNRVKRRGSGWEGHFQTSGRHLILPSWPSFFRADKIPDLYV